MTIPVILASQSPSRQRLLVQAGIRPTVRTSGVDEPQVLSEAARQVGVRADVLPVKEQVAILARAKAAAVRQVYKAVGRAEEEASGQQYLSRPLEDGYGSVRRQEDLKTVISSSAGMETVSHGPVLIGCDSLFEFDGQAQGKPHDPEVAQERLMAVSGKSGTLWTGHCVIDLASGRQVEAVSHAQVSFGAYTAEDIAAYVSTGEPLEVAGSFTIEGMGAAFIEGISGSPSAVMGLSLPLLRKLVSQLGIRWADLWNVNEEHEQLHELTAGSAQAPEENVHQPGDGWVNCACGHQHWGLNGAAGVLLARSDESTGCISEVLLQHRAEWSAEGGTWGVPGGAIADGENPIEGALRESYEEANIRPQDVDVVGTYVEDHGPWAYTTVFAREKPGRSVHPRMNDDESIELAWVPLDEVANKRLLGAFGRDWPAFYSRLRAFPAQASTQS